MYCFAITHVCHWQNFKRAIIILNDPIVIYMGRPGDNGVENVVNSHTNFNRH